MNIRRMSKVSFISLFGVSLSFQVLAEPMEEEVEVLPEALQQEVSELEVDPEGYYCPKPFEYQKDTSLCQYGVNVLGPFTPKMEELCIKYEGGDPCLHNVWDIQMVLDIKNGEKCSPGTFYDETRGYCSNGEEIYGPFKNKHVQQCIEKKGGMACRTLKWSQNLVKPVEVKKFKSLKAKVYGFHEITPDPLPTDPGAVTPLQLENFIIRAIVDKCEFLSPYNTMFSERAKSILLTFDDGYEGNYTHAFQILKKYGVPGVFFIHPETIGTVAGAYPKMTWEQVKEIAEHPLMEIGSHTLRHLNLTELTEEELLDNLSKSNQMIKDNIGYNPKFVAYPMGQNSKTVRAVSQKLHEFGFAYGEASFNHPLNKYALPREPIYANNVNKRISCK